MFPTWPCSSAPTLPGFSSPLSQRFHFSGINFCLAGDFISSCRPRRLAPPPPLTVRFLCCYMASPRILPTTPRPDSPPRSPPFTYLLYPESPKAVTPLSHDLSRLHLCPSSTTAQRPILHPTPPEPAPTHPPKPPPPTLKLSSNFVLAVHPPYCLPPNFLFFRATSKQGFLPLFSFWIFIPFFVSDFPLTRSVSNASPNFENTSVSTVPVFPPRVPASSRHPMAFT